MFKPLAIALVAAALAACSPSAPKISARDGWARETGTSNMAAAYVTIENKGGADTLISVRSTVGEATLHESTVEGGVMRMRPIDPKDGLSVPSNGKLVLGPGGAHVMIMGLKQPLEAGDDFGLTLLFAKARPERVTVTVKPAGQ